MREYIAILAAAFLLLTSPAYGQEDPVETKQDSKSAEVEEQETDTEQTEQAKKIAEAKARADELQQQFGKKMRETREEFSDDRDAMMEAIEKSQTEIMAEMKELGTGVIDVAKQADADSESSFEAIRWLLDSPLTEFHIVAGDLIIEHHINNDKIPELLQSLKMPTQAAQDVFEKVIEKCESREIRGQVSMTLVDFLASAKQLAPMMTQDETIAKMYPEAAEYLGSETIQGLDEEAILEKMKTLVSEYGDVEFGGKTIEDLLARKMKAIEVRSRVAVGKVAPDIEGPDIDGENFKLSDYRGKVVMLDFWGDW